MIAPDPRGDASALLCAVLRGTPRVDQELADAGRQAAFVAAATRHRVRPLLAWLLRQRRELEQWPAAIREPLLAAERAEAIVEACRRAELGRLLRAFERHQVPVLLLKGAALAYSHYPEPWLRPREDTDLLVRPADAARASAVIEQAGYLAFRSVSGAIVSHQQSYRRDAGGGIRHDVDLHWKPFNPVPLSDLLAPDELLDTAATISPAGLSPARVARPEYALLLACLHRAGHHPGSRDLLWIFDIHLLVERLSHGEAAALVATARRTGTGALCADALRLAVECFQSRLPVPDLLAELQRGSHGLPPSLYLRPRLRKADLLRADLAALPTWRRRFQLLREHLFPPASYMLARTGTRGRILLPVLYLLRIARGAGGWFTPLGADERDRETGQRSGDRFDS